MPIEDPNVIDITTRGEGGLVGLAMSAAREWEEGSVQRLHAKLNTYLGYIQSPRFLEDHPDAQKIEMRLAHRYPLSAEAAQFVERVQAWLPTAGLPLPTSFGLLDMSGE